MPTSRNSSNTSAPCRLEWRPSRLLVAALGAFGALAAVAVTGSDLPTLVAWPLAFVALAYGFHLARQESRKPSRVLVIADDGARTTVGEIAVTEFAVDWRGPLAFARWRDADGERHRLVWWPDTLGHTGRRELRLAVPARSPSRSPASMAT